MKTMLLSCNGFGPAVALFGSLVLLLLCAPEVNANVGWISDGGSAHLLSENATVAMESEVVNIQVSKNLVRAECSFKFVNHGPACTVRMGFPDLCSEPRHSEDKSIKGAFLSFESFIDGTSVKTDTVDGGWQHSDYTVWHANEVSFEANGRRDIKSVYTLCPGFGLVSEAGYAAKIVAYTLHTAASWHDKVNTAVVTFRFDKDVIPKDIVLVDVNKLPEEDVTEYNWSRATAGTILYKTSVKPVVMGNSVQFEFRDFRATKKDDIAIFYDRMGRQEASKYVRMVESVYSPEK